MFFTLLAIIIFSAILTYGILFVMKRGTTNWRRAAYEENQRQQDQMIIYTVRPATNDIGFVPRIAPPKYQEKDDLPSYDDVIAQSPQPQQPQIQNQQQIDPNPNRQNVY